MTTVILDRFYRYNEYTMHQSAMHMHRYLKANNIRNTLITCEEMNRPSTSLEPWWVITLEFESERDYTMFALKQTARIKRSNNQTFFDWSEEDEMNGLL